MQQRTLGDLRRELADRLNMSAQAMSPAIQRVLNSFLREAHDNLCQQYAWPEFRRDWLFTMVPGQTLYPVPVDDCGYLPDLLRIDSLSFSDHGVWIELPQGIEPWRYTVDQRMPPARWDISHGNANPAVQPPGIVSPTPRTPKINFLLANDVANHAVRKIHPDGADVAGFKFRSAVPTWTINTAHVASAIPLGSDPGAFLLSGMFIASNPNDSTQGMGTPVARMSADGVLYLLPGLDGYSLGTFWPRLLPAGANRTFTAVDGVSNGKSTLFLLDDAGSIVQQADAPNGMLVGYAALVNGALWLRQMVGDAFSGPNDVLQQIDPVTLAPLGAPVQINFKSGGSNVPIVGFGEHVVAIANGNGADSVLVYQADGTRVPFGAFTQTVSQVLMNAPLASDGQWLYFPMLNTASATMGNHWTLGRVAADGAPDIVFSLTNPNQAAHSIQIGGPAKIVLWHDLIGVNYDDDTFRFITADGTAADDVVKPISGSNGFLYIDGN